MESKQDKIVVLGSASQDYFFKIDRIPQIGETIDAHGCEKSYGGKGANQAITCAKLGAKCEMLVQLGNDESGRGYIEEFKKHGVETKNIKLLDGVDTGQAYILALKDGNNSIIINGAANAAYDPNMTELDPAWAEAVRTSKILLLQREVPEYVNIVAARTAKQAGTMVILDVGGRDEPLSEELLSLTELERVINHKVVTFEEAKHALEKFVGDHETNEIHRDLTVVLKMGEHGSAYLKYTKGQGEIMEVHQKAFDINDFPHLKLVDTTGAGDCFSGGFAVKMLEGATPEEALVFGNKAGFLAITKFGAGPAIPTLQEVLETFKD
ncbi:pfkb family protein [Stylonychia lemnae]|uniref:Ribokinase n=1 Tax=Stylonychia lemnae TaxID=5949 RepID=A0A078AYT7_STYLE|nr:pfkb family protein [Stylonychia lemnae]|eukprot:CDW85938.1 pfkb family protein [Stylonychia lemnae]